MHIDPCNPSPCGTNALCKEQNGAGSCTCLPEYFGDPYTDCRPECVMNSDCPKTKACRNMKCQDPCVGVCGRNAECHVTNHSPYCSCFAGFTGNPSTACHEIQRRTTSCLSTNLTLIYFTNIFDRLQNPQFTPIHVFHRHAALTVNVGMLMSMPCAHVIRTTSEVHRLADPSARPAQIVRSTKHARTNDASIRVREHVA